MVIRYEVLGHCFDLWPCAALPRMSLLRTSIHNNRGKSGGNATEDGKYIG